mmetsp:Transcript_23190/g.48165  ORF Transcript_23190/g.48165 Transcript_23190/m.48165 type:complete len:248 (-) Transcript_23190:117-860(-)
MEVPLAHLINQGIESYIRIFCVYNRSDEALYHKIQKKKKHRYRNMMYTQPKISVDDFGADQMEDFFEFSSSSSHSSSISSSTSRGGFLIEDWPHNKFKIKQVRFSESSNLRIYPNDDGNNKSYNSAERKVFSTNAITEAAKITIILSKMPEGPYHQKPETCFRLLETHGLEREVIVGLEHLVLEKSPRAIIKARQMHVRSILLEQERQNILGLKDEDSLALASKSTSRRSSFQARVRASTHHEKSCI